MLVDELTTYESWDLEKPVIPPRSRLYHLEPIGVGTPYVESLTGYVARLAEAHCTSIRTLILTEINPLIKEESVFAGLSGTQTEYIYGGNRNTKTLNGTSLKAARLVQGLKALTLRSDLPYLTMLTWADLLSTTGLTRPVKAWCSICYEEWNATGQVVYEPLIWAIEVVTVCPRHYRRLQTLCPHCHKYVSIFSQLGHCSKCGRWLGMSSESDSEVLSEDELKWQHWVVNNVGDLLATASRLSSPLSRDRLKKAVSACANQVAKGNLSALARLCGGKHLQWYEKLIGWHSDSKIPQLDNLLHFCYCLETPLLDFFTKEVVIADSDRLATLLQDRQQPQPKQPRRRFDCDKAQAILQSALSEFPPPSPTEVRRRIGSATTNIYRHFSDLCHVISSRYADYEKAKSLEEMRHQLETALESDEYPPPSVNEVQRRSKVDADTLHKHFPDLCSAISARYESYRKAAKVERMERRSQEVRQVALELHAKGVTPNGNNVSKYLTKPGEMRLEEAQTALNEVRRELGF